MVQDHEILVVGGTGKTGRRVVKRLEARGMVPRIGSRSATPPFDWGDVTTWAGALEDIKRVYLSYYPDLAVPGAVEAVQTFVDQAVASGVERIVLLAGRGEEEAEHAEQVVQRSGLEWTVLRASWFSQNFSENYLLEPVLSGEVALPVSDVGEPFVDADDIAEVAVAALTEDRHIGQVYELTGPRLLTFASALAEISRATGREISFSPVTVEQYKEMLDAEGVPDEFIWLLGYLFTTVLDGRNACLADGVERALGRPPKDFADYARENAASGVWDSSVGQVAD